LGWAVLLLVPAQTACSVQSHQQEAVLVELLLVIGSMQEKMAVLAAVAAAEQLTAQA
jgi:hypothetical protein